jgi:hypothetical protein
MSGQNSYAEEVQKEPEGVQESQQAEDHFLF